MGIGFQNKSFYLSRVTWRIRRYLPGWLDTFEDTEVADDPAEQETSSQVPAQTAHDLDPSRQTQDSSPVCGESLGLHWCTMSVSFEWSGNFFYDLTAKTLWLMLLHFDWGGHRMTHSDGDQCRFLAVDVFKEKIDANMWTQLKPTIHFAVCSRLLPVFQVLLQLTHGRTVWKEENR